MPRSVVLACDRDPGGWRQAMAIRAFLESRCLRVYFYHLNDKGQVLDFLAGDRVESGYTVFCCHGTRTEEDGPYLLLTAVERVLLDTPEDGFDDEWRDVTLKGTSTWLAEHLRKGSGVFLSTGCKTGQGEIAEAFLSAGYSGYIGCADTVDMGSGTLFVLSFFHHLLAGERDLPTVTFDDRGAVERARLVDPEAFRWGTHGFRYFGR